MKLGGGRLVYTKHSVNVIYYYCHFICFQYIFICPHQILGGLPHKIILYIYIIIHMYIICHIITHGQETDWNNIRVLSVQYSMVIQLVINQESNGKDPGRIHF